MGYRNWQTKTDNDTHIHTYIHTELYTYKTTYIRTYIYRKIHTYVHTHVSIYTCINTHIHINVKLLRWSRGSVLAFGTQVRGFKPGRSCRIFQGEKILSTPSFGREVKQFVLCRRFTAYKSSLNVTWKSAIFRQNSSAVSRPSSSSFHH